jgi:predicted outer membrane repeat protein
MTVSDCLFEGNLGNYSGGALSSQGSTLLVERCDFINNSCNYHGGAISTVWDSCLYRYCTIAGNTAGTRGGGFLISDQHQVQIDHCTIVENDAVGEYGGIGSGGDYQGDDLIEVTNTIIAYNTAGSVDCEYDPDQYYFSCTNIFGNEGVDWTECIADQFGVSGNISVDPLFCGDSNPLNPWALHDTSPCRPNAYPCQQMGSQGIGCGYSEIMADDLQETGITVGDVYPNPVRGSSTLRYVLTESQPKPVTIRVIDISGRLIRTLKSNAGETPGEYEVTWDGTGQNNLSQPSGVYYFQVRIGDQVMKRRVILLKEK